MSKIRQRTKHLIYAGLAGAFAVGLFSTILIVYNNIQYEKKKIEIRDAYEKQIEQLNEIQREEQAKKKRVFLLNKDIKAGTKIKPDDIRQVDILADKVPEDSLTNPDTVINKTIKIDATKNTALTPAILYDEGVTPNDLRYQEFNVIKLPSDLSTNQYVDVRINFPTGQDYIVLSKKKVRKLVGATSTVWYEVDEKEILSMSSAIVDAFVNGAKLYAITYTDPEFQNMAHTTYPVNEKVRELIKNDPNIVELAKVELNKSLRIQLDKDLASLNEVDKMKYTTGSASYQANNTIVNQEQEQSGNGLNNNQTSTDVNSSGLHNNGAETPKNEILEPNMNNSIPADKQQDIFEQNKNAINP